MHMYSLQPANEVPVKHNQLFVHTCLNTSQIA